MSRPALNLNKSYNVIYLNKLGNKVRVYINGSNEKQVVNNIKNRKDFSELVSVSNSKTLQKTGVHF